MLRCVVMICLLCLLPLATVAQGRLPAVWGRVFSADTLGDLQDRWRWVVRALPRPTADRDARQRSPPDLSGHRGAGVNSALHGDQDPIPQGPALTITPAGLVIIGSISLGLGRDARTARQPAGTRRLRSVLALSGARSVTYDRAAPPEILLGIGPAPPGLRF